MELKQQQEQSLEMQLDRIRRQLSEIQATQDIMVNYVQAVAMAMGLKEKIKLLDERLQEIRDGNVDDDKRERDTVP